MKLRKFDTKVQHLKYKVLREVARLAWKDELLEKVMELPKVISPGATPPRPTMIPLRKRAIATPVCNII